MSDGLSGTQGGQQTSAGQQATGGGTASDEAAKGAEFEKVFLEAITTNMVFDGYNEGERMRGEQWQRQQEDETIS